MIYGIGKLFAIFMIGMLIMPVAIAKDVSGSGDNTGTNVQSSGPGAQSTSTPDETPDDTPADMPDDIRQEDRQSDRRADRQSDRASETELGDDRRESEARGGENEIRENGDSSGIRGSDDSCSSHKGKDSSGERLEITSDSFDGSTEVKVKLDFVTDSAGSEIAKDIMERLKLDSSDVDSMLVMDDNMEDLVERTKVSVKEDSGGRRVRFEMKFPMNTEDRDAVVEGIAAKLDSIELEDIESDVSEKVEARRSAKEVGTQSKSRSVVDDLSDMISGVFGSIFGMQTTVETKLDAQLFSTANINFGEAEFEMLAGRKTLSVGTENMANLGFAEGGVFSVLVNDIFVGDMTLAARPLGGIAGNLVLDTLNGASVPDIAAGDNIRVTDAAGTTILSGAFVARVTAATSNQQAASARTGIVIDKTLSKGPGYPTGPLNIIVPSTQLTLDRVGQEKIQPGSIEAKDRQYEVEFAAIPVTINSVVYTATEIKVISNLKVKAGSGQQSGTIDVDIDMLPGGHVTLQYQGAASVVGSTIASSGTFKTSKTTGVFAGLVAEGTYSMTIIEPSNVFGTPVTVSITTTSV